MNPEVSIIIPTYNRSKYVSDCLNSILKSNYTNFEIIVVDNNSTDDTVAILKNKFSNYIQLIECKKNFSAAEGRNIGAKHAKGKYLLFIDDDNVVDENMIKVLVYWIEKLPNAGIVGPKTYYYNSKKVWWAGSNVNLFMGISNHENIGKIDTGQFNSIKKTGYVPNIELCCKSDFEKVKGFNEKYKIMYEDADFGEKIKKIGKVAYLIPTAFAWHNTPLYNASKLRTFNVHTKERAFLSARNRVYFMKQHSKSYLFFLLFLPFIHLFYLILFLKNNQLSLFKHYINGTLTGLNYD